MAREVGELELRRDFETRVSCHPLPWEEMGVPKYVCLNAGSVLLR